MSLLLPTGYRCTLADGTPAAAAELYTYQEGTTTPQATYSNEALSSANANPIVANSSGYFSSAIYGLKTVNYKLTLKDASGNTLWTQDNLAGRSSVTKEETQRKKVIASPIDYGAVGDGSTNDYTALAAAVADSPGVIDLEGRTYRCNSILSLPTGCTIQNGTIDFSQGSATDGLKILGTLGGSVSISSTGTSSVVVSSAAGLAAGDLVLIQSVDLMDSGADAWGEMHRVESVSGTTVNFFDRVIGTYTTTPTLKKLTPVTDVTISGVTIIPSSSGGSIYAKYASRVTVSSSRVKLASTTNGSVRFETCADIVVRDSMVDASFLSNGQSEAGFGVTGCSLSAQFTNCRVVGGGASDAAFGVGITYSGVVEGVTRQVQFTDCRGEWVLKGIETNEGSYDVTFSGCKITGDTSASMASIFLARFYGGNNVRVHGCIFKASGTTNPALSITPTATLDALVVDGCSSGAGIGAGFATINTTKAVSRLLVSGNTTTSNVTGAFVDWTAGSLTAARIQNNSCIFSNTTTVAFDFTPTGSYTASVLFFSGNTVTIGSGTAAVSLSAASGLVDVECEQNVISSTGSSAAILYAVTGTDTRVRFRGNTVFSTTDGIEITIATGATLNDLVLDSNTIRTTSSSASEYLFSVVTSGTGVIDRATVSGNTFTRSNDSGDNIELNGAAAASIGNVAFSGNVIHNGVYGIDLTNGSNVSISGDVFTGQSTADYNGTFKIDGEYVTSVSITATEIVGTSAGDLGHASGVTLVSAVASRIIEPRAVVVNFTFATGQYGDGGGNLSAKYDGGANATGTITTLSTIGAASSNISILRAATGLALVNTKLVLVASAAMTAGTGAGTAVIKTYYRLLAA